MRKQFIIILLACLVLFGLVVSCKNEVTNAGFGEELVSVSFKEDMARGLTATLEGFDKDHLYWAYAAKKADGSQLISGQTANYGQTNETRVWIKTDGYNNPVAGLGTTGSTGYETYKVPGFSQGYWNFRLYAYKRSGAGTTQDPYTYQLVYQGETLNVLLKSDSVNTQGSHLVNVIVDPVQSEGNGTMVFLTNKSHLPADRISMNTVNSATYGTNYTVKVLSILSIEEIPVEYVDTAAEEQAATDGQDGLYNLPAGSYKVTVAFTDSASAPSVNYAKGTIVATVYSNLTTTISGDLTEAMTYAEFDGELNPDLETVTASNDQPIVKEDDPTKTVVLTTNTSAAKEVTATIKAGDTNKIINDMADTAGTNTDAYNQNLNLTLSVETVETTATTATYEIGMTAELKSIKISDQSTTTTTSDVSEVDEYVRVEVQLETGLTAVNVLHDGLQMVQGLENPDPNNVGKFAYNAVSGVLTIETKSFSPFAVSFVKPEAATYVAQVGNVKYQSLAAAIVAAKEDGTDTITLLNDVSLLSATVINKKVVLDLAGYKITATAGLTASVDETTIKNGSIAGALTVSGSNIGLSAVTVTGSVDVSGSAAFDSDCSVTGTAGVAYAINVTGSIVIEGGTYAAAEGEDKYILSGNATISDGNFKGELAPSNAENIVLTGGTYGQDESSYVPVGYECVEISAGVFKVRSTVEAVNVNTGVEYFYLQNAIDAASAGDTVKLLRSITPSSTIKVEAKTITLDLDGKTIIAHATPVILNLGGNLTINGAEAIINGYTGKTDGGVIRSVSDGTQTATLVINGGTYNSKLENGGSVIYSDGVLTINGGSFNGASKAGSGWPSYAINNYGTLTMTDAVVTSIHGSIATCGSEASSTLNNVTATLSPDGSATGLTSHVIYTYDGGSVVINSGTYWNKASDASSTGADVVCNNNGTKSDETTITINGGLFKCNNVDLSEYSNGDILVKGGTFDHNPSAYVVEGYYARNNGDGTWSVLPVVTIIKANQSVVGYPDLQSALNVVEDGDEILLNKSVTYSPDASYVVSHRIIGANNSILALDRSVEAVLNLQGNTITCNYPELSQAGYFFLISGDESNKVFEIKNGEINIDWPNHQTHNVLGYGYDTYTARDVAIKLINSACMKISGITIKTDSCGIILENQSRITELNANVLCVREELDKKYNKNAKQIDPSIVNAFKCIIVGSPSSGTSCRIDLISGGMYSSTIGESAYDDDTFGRGFIGDNASVDIYSNSVIGEISGGVFTSDVFSGSGTVQRVCAIWVRTGGRIDSITGGEFRFTEPSEIAGCYSLNNYPTFPLCIEGEVGSITGGLFQEGYFHYKEKPGMSVDSKGHFDSIVDASGCEKTIVEARAVTISAGTTYERVLDMYEIVQKSGE